MEKVLEVAHLSKCYPGFTLDDVSFSLLSGTITGFIGRNGAGKTTTLRSLLNLVHPDGGSVRFFGMNFTEHELEIKRQIGFVSGAVGFYPRKELGAITAVSRQFYDNWDGEAYRRCLREFGLSENKKPAELSEGMKVKYALTLALSHRARLLILDEPTSGLDPVSREELLETFLHLVRQEGVTLLFSTHITSDLDKCADEILYIRKGKLVEQGPLDAFVSGYRVVTTAEKPGGDVIGARECRNGWSGLIHSGDPVPAGTAAGNADLESVMVHLEQEA